MIIFGLGNPGLRYRATRHNIGYIVCERWARRYHKRFRMRQGYSIATFTSAGHTVHVIKPHSWMNTSGDAVSAILGDIDDTFLIVVDDVNLPLGRLRLRSAGSDGGHRGLRSIIEALATSDFPRLRIGIGRPEHDTSTYVLSRFTKKEKEMVQAIIEKAIQGMEILLREGFERAQNFINANDITVKSEKRNRKFQRGRNADNNT